MSNTKNITDGNNPHNMNSTNHSNYTNYGNNTNHNSDADHHYHTTTTTNNTNDSTTDITSLEIVGFKNIEQQEELSDDIYQENVLDHYKNPHRKKVLEHVSFQHHEMNPLCGDMLTFYFLVEDNIIKDISFTGYGCVISQASASLLADYLYQQQVEVIDSLTPEKVYQLLGIPISHGRIKCALLSFVTVTAGFAQHKQELVKYSLKI